MLHSKQCYGSEFPPSVLTGRPFFDGEVFTDKITSLTSPTFPFLSKICTRDSRCWFWAPSLLFALEQLCLRSVALPVTTCHLGTSWQSDLDRVVRLDAMLLASPAFSLVFPLPDPHVRTLHNHWTMIDISLYFLHGTITWRPMYQLISWYDYLEIWPFCYFGCFVQ